MDGSRNFHAKKQGLNIQKPLKPSEYTKSYDPLIDLDGCKAKFKDRAELDKVYQELKDMQWTKTPTQKGGNCMDYVQAVLKHLLDGKHITSIPQAFTKLYDENYEKVALKVYGVKPT
ncbi:hypothetical protein BT96DRAFT_919762 [Gymnopus androsaceus JB14]|uniref:Uncharacterized protein n=1 Tax=Gymnopus androsaceus JB14 TaxID=1447944 RepID=A0A6A4HSR9_9AGAR|nr:hypothetical protein BT96DRAFT_919762 [Gymnopus androsaceus JB14]